MKPKESQPEEIQYARRVRKIRERADINEKIVSVLNLLLRDDIRKIYGLVLPKDFMERLKGVTVSVNEILEPEKVTSKNPIKVALNFSMKIDEIEELLERNVEKIDEEIKRLETQQLPEEQKKETKYMLIGRKKNLNSYCGILRNAKKQGLKELSIFVELALWCNKVGTPWNLKITSLKLNGQDVRPKTSKILQTRPGVIENLNFILKGDEAEVTIIYQPKSGEELSPIMLEPKKLPVQLF